MKICLQPWLQLHIHLSGNIWFCCMKPSRTQKINLERIEEVDFLDTINCNEVVTLRETFLSGIVPAFCKGCMMLHDYSSLEEFKEELVKEQCQIQSDVASENLKYLTGIKEVFFEFTTKCNYKCVYCLHSTGAFQSRIASIDTSKFYEILKSLVKQAGIGRLSTTGIGEFTLLSDWEDIINMVSEKYPELQLTMFSNFGKKLTDEELLTMTKLENINISMDTSDKELFQELRSGNLDIVLDNLSRFRKISRLTGANTTVTIACVVNDRIFYRLEELLDFLAADDLCDAMTLTPMTLPKPACSALNIYPMTAETGTEKYLGIGKYLKDLYHKGRENRIDITWSGDLLDFYRV